MPVLVVDSPALPTRARVPFEKVMVIGRAPESDLQLLDGRISKRHTVIRPLGDGVYVVEDLGSRNGTLVNGKPIKAPTEIVNGDVVQVGDSRISFEVEEPSRPLPDPKNKRSTTTMTIRSKAVRHDFPPASQVSSPAQLAEDYDRLRLAWRLGMETGVDRPMADQARRILGMLLAEFDADRGIIMLFPSHDTERVDPNLLQMLAVSVGEDVDADKPTRIPRALLRVVLQERRGVLAADARSDARFDTSSSMVMQGIRSTLCVPLVARGGTMMGVMALDSTRVVNAFHEKDLVVLETVGTGIATAVENTRLVESMREQAIVRDRLSRVLSPNLVEEVVAGHLKITDTGETRNVTILFTDVRGFTSLSQRYGPAEVLRMLNTYFARAVEIVFKHEGTLDKFMGDGLMALFGAPIAMADASLRAVEAATEIQRAVDIWNRERAGAGHEPFEIGIGVAAGPVVAGAMGTDKTMAYTVVGPAANLASRLCSVAAGGEVLVSDAIYRSIGDKVGWKQPRMVDLKGYSQPLPAWPVKT